MSLDKNILKDKFQAIQDNHPSSINLAAEVWSDAVFSYTKDAVTLNIASSPTSDNPGRNFMLPIFDQQMLYDSFLSSLNSSTFIDDLGKNLSSLWSSAVWNKPPEISEKENITVEILDLPDFDTLTLSKNLSNEQVSQNVSIILSDSIHEWTKSIQVKITLGSGQSANRFIF